MNIEKAVPGVVWWVISLLNRYDIVQQLGYVFLGRGARMTKRETALRRMARKVKALLNKYDISLILKYVVYDDKGDTSHYWFGEAFISPAHIKDVEVYAHEMGHAFYEQFNIGLRADFAKRFGKPIGVVRTFWRQILRENLIVNPYEYDDNKFLTDYCTISAQEDFCECFSHVLCGFDTEDHPRSVRAKLKYVERILERYRGFEIVQGE